MKIISKNFKIEIKLVIEILEQLIFISLSLFSIISIILSLSNFWLLLIELVVLIVCTSWNRYKTRKFIDLIKCGLAKDNKVNILIYLFILSVKIPLNFIKMKSYD